MFLSKDFSLFKRKGLHIFVYIMVNQLQHITKKIYVYPSYQKNEFKRFLFWKIKRIDFYK